MQGRVALALIALCLAVASADRFSVTVQPFSRAVLDRAAQQDGTVYVSSGAAFARDAELDNDLPTVLFDSSLQSWMDQQMGVIDALHSLFAPRSPCGGRASSAAMQDPSFAYMTSSRFSPALLTTYLEQWQVDDQDVMLPEEDADEDSVEQASADETAWSSVFESTGAEAMDRVRQFPDWLEAEEVQGEADEEAARRTLFAPGEQEAQAVEPTKEHGKGKNHHKGKDHKLKDDKHKAKEGHEHGMHHKNHMASCSQMFTFAVLLVGCVVVWGCLLRTAVRCSKMIRKHKQRAARRSAVVEQNPLLAPLVREDSLHVPQVAVASYEVPAGSYYMPEGSNYVRVAYQPLSSE